MNDVVPFLAVLLVLVGVVAAPRSAVHITIRSSLRERIGYHPRLQFRIYLYLITVISIVFPASGASAQEQALGSP